VASDIARQIDPFGLQKAEAVFHYRIFQTISRRERLGTIRCRRSKSLVVIDAILAATNGVYLLFFFVAEHGASDYFDRWDPGLCWGALGRVF
jgi:hypothetical protein